METLQQMPVETPCALYGPPSGDDLRDEDAERMIRSVLKGVTVAPMSTRNCMLNPRQLNHQWTLNGTTGLPDIKGLSQEHLQIGFRLFFVNRHDEALHFFEMFENVPLMAMGKAAIMFVWSTMTLDDDDLKNTVAYIKEVEVVVDALVKSTAPSGGGWLGVFAKTPVPTATHLHYRIMSAECTLLISVMQLLRESLMEKVKGALNIRNAWHKYKAIKEQKELLEGDGGALDIETVGAMHFGIGAFNLVSSLLPPKVLALISFLGFPCDRQLGLEELETAFNKGGVRSPIASLALLTHHVFLQASFCHNDLVYADAAERVIRRSLEMCANGGLFLLFNARQLRLAKDIDGAIEHFKLAARVQHKWIPLVHYCSYELAYTHLYRFEYLQSAAHWNKLLVENEWSKAYYAYAKGVVLLCGKKPAEARAAFDLIPALLSKSKKINGRPLPVDRFVKRKYVNYIEETGEQSLKRKGARASVATRLPLAGIEMIYVWNGFPQMPRPLLNKCLDEVKAWRATDFGSSSADAQVGKSESPTQGTTRWRCDGHRHSRFVLYLAVDALCEMLCLCSVLQSVCSVWVGCVQQAMCAPGGRTKSWLQPFLQSDCSCAHS
eukprot:m.1490665 g.1490665  ORF g.1490665 m.1490665 type:complete len:607 (+) comp25191_c0_seq17:397-2217(+)